MTRRPRRTCRLFRLPGPLTIRAAITLVIVLGGCAAPPGASSPAVDAPESVSPQASASPSAATPSVSEAPSPSAAASPDAPEGTVEVGALARTTVERLRIREEPGLEGASLGTLAESEVGYVLAGPVPADGYDWYLLSALSLPQASGCITPIDTDPYNCPTWLGWAAARGPDGDPWLVAGTIDCPLWPSPLMTADFVFGVQRYAYLACFGDEERSVVGFYPEFPENGGLGGACADVPDELAWIGCNLGYEHVVFDPATGFFGPGLVLTIEPASGVQLPGRGQWIEVTGQYDHPAAQQCTWGDPPEATVLLCRAQFVVASARAVSAP